MSNLEDREIERGTEIERTAYFSDAVIAIAITLLALNLEVPEIPSGPVAAELPGRLLELRSQFLSFVISFLVIGNYWMAHHRTFNYIRGYDRRLLLLNFLFLMWVVLMPFSASLLGEYHDQQISVVLYATNMVLAGLTLSWLCGGTRGVISAWSRRTSTRASCGTTTCGARSCRSSSCSR